MIYRIQAEGYALRLQLRPTVLEIMQESLTGVTDHKIASVILLHHTSFHTVSLLIKHLMILQMCNPESSPWLRSSYTSCSCLPFRIDLLPFSVLTNGLAISQFSGPSFCPSDDSTWCLTQGLCTHNISAEKVLTTDLHMASFFSTSRF